MKAQRLRVQFTRGDDLKYVTHLDMMRFWERALRRADVPIAYSEGFSPHPQIALAAPLAVGVTSEAELLDVFLDRPMPPAEFRERLTAQLPPAVRIIKVTEVGVNLPSMQAEIKAAEYLVDVALDAPTAAATFDGPGPSNAPPDAPADETAVRERIARFMASETFPWEHKREDEVRSYDLRAMVHELAVAGASDGRLTLRMLLRNDNAGSGRPEQVALALGLGQPLRIHRTRLVLPERSQALAAWRERGRFSE